VLGIGIQARDVLFHLSLVQVYGFDAGFLVKIFTDFYSFLLLIAVYKVFDCFNYLVRVFKTWFLIKVHNLYSTASKI
jgi:hypothetical protein